MAIKVLYKGLEVACDDREDLDRLAGWMSAPSTSTPRQTGRRPAKHRQNGHRKAASANVYDFVRGLSDKNKRLLVALVSEGGRATDSRLRGSLGFKNNNQLSGQTTALKKWATSEGFDIKLVLAKESLPEGGYEYYIPDGAIGQVRSGLGGTN